MNLGIVAAALKIREDAAKAWNANAPKDSEIQAAEEAVTAAKAKLKDAATASGDTSAASKALEAAQKHLGDLRRRRRDADKAYDKAEEMAALELAKIAPENTSTDSGAPPPRHREWQRHGKWHRFSRHRHPLHRLRQALGRCHEQDPWHRHPEARQYSRRCSVEREAHRDRDQHRHARERRGPGRPTRSAATATRADPGAAHRAGNTRGRDLSAAEPAGEGQGHCAGQDKPARPDPRPRRHPRRQRPGDLGHRHASHPRRRLDTDAQHPRRDRHTKCARVHPGALCNGSHRQCHCERSARHQRHLVGEPPHQHGRQRSPRGAAAQRILRRSRDQDQLGERRWCGRDPGQRWRAAHGWRGHADDAHGRHGRPRRRRRGQGPRAGADHGGGRWCGKRSATRQARGRRSGPRRNHRSTRGRKTERTERTPSGGVSQRTSSATTW